MFEALGLWLLQFTNGYVARVSATLAVGLAPIALAWLTVYVAHYGYAVVRGEVQEPMGTFAWKMVKMAFILALSLTGLHYMSLVFTTANGLQDGMAVIFLRGGGYDDSAPATVFGALDAANNRADELVKDLWKEAGWQRLDLFAAAVIFGLGNAIFLIVGAYVTLLSKVVLTFALAIGPIAILCLMFKPTARFFDSWLSLMLSAIVLAWFVFFALGLSFYVAQETTKAIAISGAFLATANATGPTAIAASDGFVIVSTLLAVLLYQAPSLASALTGGASIQMGYQMVSNTLVAMRAATGLVAPAKEPPSSGGSLTRGGGVAHGVGRAAGAVSSAGKAAYQRIAARGSSH